MRYVRFGATGLQVSAFGLGTMGYGSSAWRPWVLDEAEAAPILKRALDLGINFFDMADFYSLGANEEVVGRTLLSLTRREDLVLASKVYYALSDAPNDQGLSRKHILSAIDGTLTRLGTDHVDLYIIHAFDPGTPMEETMEALAEVVRAGKARYLGASTMYAWQLAKMNAIAERNGWPRFVNMQCQYSLLYREEEREMMPYCRHEGIAVTTFSPLARGMLAGANDVRAKTDTFTHDFFGDEVDVAITARVAELGRRRGVSPAQIAMSWVCHSPQVDCPLIGAQSIAELETAVGAADVELSGEERAWLEELYRPADVINDHNPVRRRRALPAGAIEGERGPMKISAIEITHHRLALDPPFKASWDGRARDHFDATVVRVRTDDGLEGWGSGDLMVGFEGHENLFIGQDPLRLERHHTVLSHIDFHYGRCWPLDLALWDLAGGIMGQPVWKLLGGRHEKVRAYASSGSLRSPAEMADVAQRYLAEGFGAMKIRFHRGDWREDVAALGAVRERVGDRLELMVDCNQGWRMPWDVEPPWTLKDALAVARELEALGVYWMEEPLHRADVEGMRRLREATDVRIAGGEMTRDPAAFRDLLVAGALDVLQPDAALVGGITGLRRIAQMAELHGAVFTPHTWTNGAGVAANLHLAAGVANAPFIEFPYDPPHWSLERRDFLLAEPLRPDGEGWLWPGDAPGLGYALNEEMLARTRR